MKKMKAKTMKRLMAVAVLVALVLALWLWSAGAGVEHDRTRRVVTARTQVLERQIDQRCDALDAKLDRIEAKLDRLLELVVPALPDAMNAAEAHSSP